MHGTRISADSAPICAAAIGEPTPSNSTRNGASIANTGTSITVTSASDGTKPRWTSVRLARVIQSDWDGSSCDTMRRL